MHVSIATIGQNKGTKRVWLEGQMLARAGFEPKTRYQVVCKDGAIILEKQSTGFRIVSARTRNEREIPIIDINSAELLSMFEGLSHVRVIFGEGEIRIEAIASEQRAKERLERTMNRINAGEPLKLASWCHGGGIMSHAIHAGMKAEGVKCELAVANEIRNDLIEHAMTANDVWTKDTIALNAPIQEVAFDDAVMSRIPLVDGLEIGIACSGASVAGRVKRGLVHPESHPEVGHLLVGFLAIVARLNPTFITLECVVPYFSAASMDIIRNQLRDLKYIVHEQEIDGADWNALEHRKRKVMVAVTKGIEFDFSKLERPTKQERTLSEILEPIALDDQRWSTMQGLKDKEARDKENGKSFAMQIFDATSSKIGTLTKGISKCRSTDPKIRHPENPDLLRNPTAIEHARAKDCPEALIEGLSQTIAHELLGQSINYNPFVSIGSLIARTLKGYRKVTQQSRDDFHDLPLFQFA